MEPATGSQVAAEQTGHTTPVSYRDVGKVYDSGEEEVVALEDVTFDVQSGEFVSVVGPSGCGKSTLLHLTAGILEPTSGSVTINGNDVHASEAHQKHNVGLVFQEPVLLDWRTVLKNILLPVEILLENGVIDGSMAEYEQKARGLLELVNVTGFDDAYPGELSGGMQQRVAICRSLIYNPPVLLMDEPFGALDALTRNELNEELLRIWRETGKTIVFVTHDLEEAVYLSDRVCVVADRPGTVADVVDVDLPRPRGQEVRRSEEYQTVLTDVMSYFE